MKKVFFAFTALTVLALTSCNTKQPETPVQENSTPVDQVENTAPADTNAAAATPENNATTPAAQ
jgi:hypothetical protein